MTYDPAKDAHDSFYAAIEAKRLRGDTHSWSAPKLYCSECDRYERDPLFLDVERCSQCGELIESSDDDGQPDEQQEWRDYDPDC